MKSLFSIILLLAALAAAAQSADSADFQRDVTQALERQRASYAADMAANRQWMQEMTREFENQNEVIRQLRDELVALRKKVATLDAEKASGGGEVDRLRSEFSRAIAKEASDRQAADQRLVERVAAEIARAAAAAPQPPPRQPAPATPAVRTIDYVVQPGDTLSAIATAFGSSVASLKSMNGLSSDVIRVGQKLSVPAP